MKATMPRSVCHGIPLHHAHEHPSVFRSHPAPIFLTNSLPFLTYFVKFVKISVINFMFAPARVVKTALLLRGDRFLAYPVLKVNKRTCVSHAPLAQLVEQATLNRQVIGSNPMRCTGIINSIRTLLHAYKPPPCAVVQAPCAAFCGNNLSAFRSYVAMEGEAGWIIYMPGWRNWQTRMA